MHQPEQLHLFDILVQPEIKAIYDPYWDEITNTVGEQLTWEDSPCKTVGEQVALATLTVAHQHDEKLYDRLSAENYTHWVEKYWVERGVNKYWYYRYTWMEVRKLNRVYIGSVLTRSSQLTKQAVEDAIFDGQSPQEIKQLIRGFSSQVSPLHHRPKFS